MAKKCFVFYDGLYIKKSINYLIYIIYLLWNKNYPKI